MNIDPLKTATTSYTVRNAAQNQNSSAAPAPASPHAGDTVSTELADKVRSSLASIPEVRPDVVARGRQLRDDPNYPSQDIVNKIAGFITPLSEE